MAFGNMGMFDKFSARGRSAKPARAGAARTSQGSRPAAGSATRAAQSRSAAAQRSQLPARRGKRGAAKRGEKGVGSSPASAQHHDRRKRLVAARESTLRDLGGLMLEMYKRNRFREELLLDKCEEVLAIEVEIAHVDQRLFQLAPPTGSGQRPIGRCECGVPILPGQNFCGVCGRSFGTLTQARNCAACGTGLRAADAFCPTCGTASPSLLDSHIPAAPGGHAIEAAATATRAADTMIINMPADPDMAPPPLLDTSMAMTPPPMTDSLSPGSSNTPPEMITSLLDDDAPPQLTSVPTVAASPAPATTTATTTAPASVAATETAIDVAVATASTSTPGAAALTPAAEAVPAGRAARKDAKRRMKATEAARRDRAKARARAKMKQAKRGGPES